MQIQKISFFFGPASPFEVATFFGTWEFAACSTFLKWSNETQISDYGCVCDKSSDLGCMLWVGIAHIADMICIFVHYWWDIAPRGVPAKSLEEEDHHGTYLVGLGHASAFMSLSREPVIVLASWSLLPSQFLMVYCMTALLTTAVDLGAYPSPIQQITMSHVNKDATNSFYPKYSYHNNHVTLSFCILLSIAPWSCDIQISFLLFSPPIALWVEMI